MAADRLARPEDADIVFRYHQEQWSHVRHHESHQSSLSLQIMVLAVALGGAYFAKVESPYPQALRVGAAVLVMALGVIGFLLVRSTQRAADSHILRARAARRSLGFLEPFANAASDFPAIHRYFLGFHVIIIVAGASLLVMAFA